MAGELIQTKINIPSLRQERVSRPRLINQLNEGLKSDCKLSLISAPAGFGKSTLLCEWIDQTNASVAWIALDERDNDPVRFLLYLVNALRKISLDWGEDLLADFSSTQPPPIEAILTRVVNDVDVISKPIGIVLDDYHSINSRAVHECLNFLLDYLPPQVVLLLGTRVDPPLNLSRLRARGQMIELRTADLRFTTDEINTFLNQVMGFDLNSEQIASLESRSEGWVAGLQMAALSMRGIENIDDFIQAFTGSHRYILDYLMEEVITRQPEPLRQFLLQTSILDRLNSSLCEVVTGEGGAQEVLEFLESANLFLIPLDDIREWYRYHHLFGDLLRQRLLKDDKAKLVELHTRAADWYEDNNLLSECVKHVLQIKDYDRAMSLIEKHGFKLLERGELMTLIDWAGSIPQEISIKRPWVQVYYAWANLLTGQTDKLDAILRPVDEYLRQGSTNLVEGNMLGHVSAIRSYAEAIKGHIPVAVEQAEIALANLNPEDQSVRSVVAFVLGGLQLLRGNFEVAYRSFIEAAQSAEAANNLNLSVRAWCSAANLEIAQGRLERSEAIYQKALAMATGSKGRPLPLAAQPFNGLALLAYERNELEAAGSMLEQSYHLASQWHSPDTTLNTLLNRVTLHLTLGEINLAWQDFDKAKQIAETHSLIPTSTILLSAIHIQLHLATKQIEKAKLLVEESNVSTIGAITYLYEVEAIAWIRLLLAQNQYDDALQILSILINRAEKEKRSGNLIKLLLIKSVALGAKNQMRQALESVSQAVLLAEPSGHIRSFVDEGKAIAELLEKVKTADTKVRIYIHTLLDVFQKTGEIQPLAEPLTERELEVLQLLSAGLSNQDIASELVIAVGTVKTHVNRIMGKLESQSRTQAVARARELNIIP